MTHYLLAGVCLWIAELAFLVAVCLKFHARGYKRGREQGYEDGFTAGKIRAEEWWADAELEVARTRETIRREEA